MQGANFVELRHYEVRRIPLLGTWMNSVVLVEQESVDGVEADKNRKQELKNASN
jgi:hypothetical protein